MNERDVIFIKHILENIIDIETFVKDISKEELEKNKEKLNAVIRSIEIIGEASKNISENFKAHHKEIIWKEIIGTRDILIHKYFGIEIEELWKIINEDIPALKIQISSILSNS